jgi:hypothetical protein
MDQDYADRAGEKKLLKTVPIRKPGKQHWVRVHSSPAYRMDLPCFELEEGREHYLVNPKYHRQVGRQAVRKTFFTAVNRQGVIFLWPVPLPKEDGKDNDWWASGRKGGGTGDEKMDTH